MKKEFLAVGFIPGEGFKVCPVDLVKHVTGQTVKVDLKRKLWKPEVNGAALVAFGNLQTDSGLSPIVTVYDPTDWPGMERLLNLVLNWKVPEKFETQEQARRRVQKSSMKSV